ncbi:hypothetical protein [Halorubrum sp. DTA46]|uniref:hypothetical protein n=1 Tax=Halorubrum sp. DTA46 TaxID=3402162 RepID=UPI003AAF9830
MTAQLDQYSAAAAPVPYPIVVTAAVGTLLLTVATMASVRSTYAMAVLVAAVLFVGSAAITGGVASVLIHDLLRGAVGYWTVTDAVWLFVFSGLLLWLTSAPVVSRDGRSKVVRRIVVDSLGAVGTAGVFATAVAAWVGFLIGGQRFYTGVTELLGGVLVTAVICIPAVIVLARWRGTRGGHAVASDASPESFPSELGDTWFDRVRRPSSRTVVYLSLIGLVWLVGGAILDVITHDLRLFPTERTLREYVAGIVGTGSTLATVGTAGAVAVYRYGAWALHLLTPAVLVAVWVTCRRSGIRTGRINES